MKYITEGIKYTGSKLKMLQHILQTVCNLSFKSVLDGFAGTTRVSQLFAQLGYNTTCNDSAIWSTVFGNCYLLSNKPNSFYQSYIDELNQLEPIYGWYSEHYGSDNPLGKKPFQLKNTMKLDSIRDRIDTYNLNYIDKCVLLTSLILALDSVDNTLGHYASYLKGWSKRSYNDLELKLPNRFEICSKNRVLNKDVFDVVNEYHDLAYFDPPYGSNNDKMPASRVRYNAYYHIWKSVILNDKPEVFGKCDRRVDSKDTVSKSVFEEFKKDEKGFLAMQAIRKLIANTNSKYVLLSYSSGGRTSKEELYDILNSIGKLLECKEIDYKKNVMGNMRWTNDWVNTDGKCFEYLFLIEKF